MMQMANGLWLA